MKLKFTEEVQAVISKISEFPERSSEPGDYDKPMNCVLELLHALDADKVKGKRWSKIRREVSFLLSLCVAEEKRTPDPAEGYTVLVGVFKSIKSGGRLPLFRLFDWHLTTASFDCPMSRSRI